MFIFDFQGDLYGRELRIFFIERIRDERRFPDAGALQKAIQSDVTKCSKILGCTSIIEFHDTWDKNRDNDK